ncbi:alpha/beta-hydrolase [Sodiomyces alkalinus F11]|uniref:Feruloyl esterase C n=1 Tax=Sodiomyces alkalinus (strain CBS 110278 / VKM F-3762 / F11) TaxID=1314773 RepID=A0A3N2PU70_SODAK|nr:alpha/beta-hydrolase [Sodiomyces alkalinus F11]ROT38057.1 alpha/beta-hydrolase [Sodiomyces alkalinus F11]
MAIISFPSAALVLGAALLPAVLAQSPGCGSNPTLNSGVHNINGRDYTLHIPQNYDNNNPHRLIFGFHWLGGSMDDVVYGNSIQPWYGLEPRSQGSAIFVAPQGRNAGWANEGGQDIDFVEAIIEAVENDLCIDQDARFATGFSFGGAMSYSLACSRASSFRAIAAIGAGPVSGCDGGNDPMAFLGIHGVSDDVFPIDIGIGLAQTFIQNNGCQWADIPQPPPGSGQSIRTDFQGCSRPVSFIAYDGGHNGAPFGPESSLAPDATWDFFVSA